MEACQIRERRLTVAPRIAIVLPPHEGFAPEAVGAIGLLVHRLAREAGGTVVGAPGAWPPFADVTFVAAPPGWGLSGGARYARGVARVLRRLRPGLIEVHNRPEIAVLLARWFPRTPVLLWLNNDPQGMRQARTARQRARLLQRMTVVTASGWLRDRFVDGLDGPAARLPPNSRVEVIYNSLDPLPEPPTQRDNLILFAGRLVHDKGADAFVAACALALPDLPGWRAAMVGADRFSPTAPDTIFVTALRPAAAAANVMLHGHQPHDAVLDLMRQAAIVCVPSRWPEPFGLVALEAMACGAALVCTPRGGLPEVAGPAALYAEPDPAALAGAIRNLAQDPARRVALAALGRHRAAEFGTARATAALSVLRARLLNRIATSVNHDAGL